jgi:hypothetical protein
MWSFEYRIRSWPADRRGTVQRWRRCSVATRPRLRLQTPGRILRLRGTRTQYSNDNKNVLHGGPIIPRLNGRHVHGRSRRFRPPWSVEEKREAEEDWGR